MKSSKDILCDEYKFSDTQRAVVHLVMEGYSNGEIATELKCGEQHVKNTLYTVYNITGVISRARLMALLWKRGWGFTTPAVDAVPVLPRGQV